MSKQCQAITKAGAACKNKARKGSDFCYPHRNYVVAVVEPTEPTALASSATGADKPTEQQAFEALADELNSMVDDMQAESPDFEPPPFTPQGFVALLKANAARFSPKMQLGLIQTIRDGMKDSSPKDFLNPETWKGMWFLLNYTVQEETAPLRSGVAKQVSKVPGGEAFLAMLENLKSINPKDFLDPETWKGMWFMLSVTAQNQVEEMRQKLMGGGADQDG